MSLEDLGARRRLEIHKTWTSTVNLALVLGFVGYILTMCFWR
jgi:hypothetical protein